MPSLVVTRQYADGTILTQAQLNAAFTSIETFINTTKINQDNIQAGGISTANLANNAVTNDKIASSTISQSKLDADLVLKLLPPGLGPLPWPSNTPPSGWLLCDGSAVNRVTYAALFAVIGTSHGSGDGSTTFNLPDARGRFLRFRDAGAGRDPDAAGRTAMNAGGNTGDAVGSIQSDQVGPHTHTVTVTDPGHAHDLIEQDTGAAAGTGSSFDSSIGGVPGASAFQAHQNTAEVLIAEAVEDNITGITAAANTNGTSETRPDNFYENAIIKY